MFTLEMSKGCWWEVMEKSKLPNVTLPCEDIDVALGRAWGSEGQLNTWAMPWEERALKQRILLRKSLIINIKAVSGSEQPRRAELLHRGTVRLHFPALGPHPEKKVHDH